MHTALLIIYRALFRVYRAIFEPCSIQGSFQRTHASRFTLRLLSCVLSCGQAPRFACYRACYLAGRPSFQRLQGFSFQRIPTSPEVSPLSCGQALITFTYWGVSWQQYPANYFFWVLLEICFWCSWKCALSRLWERWCLSRTRCCGWCGCSRC